MVQEGEKLQMPNNHKSHWLLSGLLLAMAAAIAAGQTAPAPDIIDLAQRHVSEYLAKLADLHCTESVTQERLAANGHVEASERARYDYLIMMDGDGDEFHLNESRIESSASRQKPLPMLITDGVATALLVFHPYYREGFNFEIGAEEVVDGKPAIPIHFTHIPGRRTPAALALRGRQYPLELEGTAWLNKQSGEVVKIDANLLHDMSDVGLRSMHVEVDYKPTALGKTSTIMTVPAVAVVEVTSLRQHWRNTHVYDSYKTFSADAEPDPNVKVRTESSKGNNITAAVVPTDPKEKP
jgi:hypothetical protein